MGGSLTFPVTADKPMLCMPQGGSLRLPVTSPAPASTPLQPLPQNQVTQAPRDDGMHGTWKWCEDPPAGNAPGISPTPMGAMPATVPAVMMAPGAMPGQVTAPAPNIGGQVPQVAVPGGPIMLPPIILPMQAPQSMAVSQPAVQPGVQGQADSVMQAKADVIMKNAIARANAEIQCLGAATARVVEGQQAQLLQAPTMLRSQMPPPMQMPPQVHVLPMQQPGQMQSLTGPQFPYSLVFTAVPGASCDVNTLPVEARSIGLRDDVNTCVGKNVQTELFAGLFGDRPAYACISRQVMDIAPVVGEPGAFMITCTSPNGIRIDQKTLLKGEGTVCQPPSVIEFLFSQDAGRTFDVLCAFQLDPSNRVPWGCSGATGGVQPQGPPPPLCEAPLPLQPGDRIEALWNNGHWYPAFIESVQNGGSFVIAWADNCQQDRVKPPHEVRRPTSQLPPVIQQHSAPQLQTVIQQHSAPQLQPAIQQHSAHLVQPPMQVQQNAQQTMRSPRSSGAPFWLEIGGSALREDFPADRRKVPGNLSGICVGRSHQGQLHLEALREGVLKFVSRDHFRITRGADCCYRLERLTGNPLWRVRPGERLEVKKDQAALPLAGGDIILLYTGAKDNTPDGPGSKGTLFWNFCDAQESAVTMGTRDALVATGPGGDVESVATNSVHTQEVFACPATSQGFLHAPVQNGAHSQIGGSRNPSPRRSTSPAPQAQIGRNTPPPGAPGGYGTPQHPSAPWAPQYPGAPQQEAWMQPDLSAQGGCSTPPNPGAPVQAATGVLAYDPAMAAIWQAAAAQGAYGAPQGGQVFEPRDFSNPEARARSSTPQRSPRNSEQPRGRRRDPIEDGPCDSMMLQQSHASSVFAAYAAQPQQMYPDAAQQMYLQQPQQMYGGYGQLPLTEYGHQGQLQLDGSPAGPAGMLPAPFGLDDWRTVDSQDELGRAMIPSAAATTMPSLPGTDHFGSSGFQW